MINTYRKCMPDNKTLWLLTWLWTSKWTQNSEENELRSEMPTWKVLFACGWPTACRDGATQRSSPKRRWPPGKELISPLVGACWQQCFPSTPPLVRGGITPWSAGLDLQEVFHLLARVLLKNLWNSGSLTHTPFSRSTVSKRWGQGSGGDGGHAQSP